MLQALQSIAVSFCYMECFEHAELHNQLQGLHLILGVFCKAYNNCKGFI